MSSLQTIYSHSHDLALLHVMQIYFQNVNKHYIALELDGDVIKGQQL